MAILIVLEIDVLLLVYVFRTKFFLHPFFMLDFVFTTGGLILEGIFKNALASLAIVYRLWRLFRISNLKHSRLTCSLLNLRDSKKKRRNENQKVEKKKESTSYETY